MTEAALSAVGPSFLTVEVGNERFALPATEVAEVMRVPAVTRVPLGPASLVGIANLRGAVMPVVSLHTLLGMGGHAPESARVVVIDRGAPIGLMIDRVAALGDVNGAGDEAGSGKDVPARALNIDDLLARDFGSFVRRSHYKGAPSAPLSQPEVAEADNDVSFVSFDVAGQDFALPLDSVREVIALPDEIAIVPRTDAVMLGVVTLRGQLLPLVSLEGLLGLRNGGHDSRRSRVVITHAGDMAVGLVVDGMKEILRVPPSSIDPVPVVLTRGAAEAEIQGICRLEGGRRLVSILSSDRLFRDQAIADQVALHIQENPDVDTTDMGSSIDEQFIVFQLGGEEYGLPIASVDEVVRLPDTLSRLPKAPAFIEGVMNLRGHVVPVIDQRQRFNLEERGERRRERVVIVTIDHMQAGFVVDGVSEVLRIPADQLRPTPDLAVDGSQVIDRIANIEIEGRMILLLNPRELLDRAEKDLLAAMGADNPDRQPS